MTKRPNTSPKIVKNDKTQTLRKLSHCVFKLEASQGHLAWKVTDLVRKTKISRALIYRYLGGSKPEILENAFKNFITDFYGFEFSKESIPFSEHIFRARERMIENPEAILFYQKWRSQESPLQIEFKKIEMKFQAKLRKLFPNLSDDEIIVRHSVIHGLVTSPFLEPQQAANIYTHLFGN